MPKQFADLTSSKLVQIEFDLNKKPAKKKANTKKGCEFCPLDKAEGTHKIKNFKRITGKKIFVWGQHPSAKDNDLDLELSGPAGKLFWEEMKAIGIARSDCDVQNVVRCMPPIWDEDYETWRDRSPTSEEYKCCSIHNEKAVQLNNKKAKVHIVLGQSAAKILLSREYKKDTPIFWSEKLQAKVVCVDHPTYFLKGAPKYRLEQFRERLKTALTFLKHSGKYSMLQKKDYELLYRPKEVRAYFRYIKKFALRKKRSVVVDIETGWIKDNLNSDELREQKVCAATPGATNTMLMIGFCHAPGIVRSVVLDHPDSNVPRKVKSKVKRLVANFLQDPEVEKVMHYGSSDYDGVEAYFGIRIKNYWFDTNYSTYLMWPQLKKYGLDNLSKEKLPEFSGYKDIIKDYTVKDSINFATIPLKILKRYNGGDCDVTKRLEILTRKPLLQRDKNSKPLLKTYRHVAFTLRDMQPRGPFYDLAYSKRLTKAVKIRLKKKLRLLRKMAKMPELNPRSAVQVKEAIYKRLKLPVITVKRKEGRTDEGTLKVLQAKTKHPFIEELLDYRGYSVMKNTQLAGYTLSAKTWRRLRTIWWLTGAITGRLRSGGKDEDAIVNLQNIPKAAVMKNLLLSTKRWRRIKKWFKEKNWDAILDLKTFMISDYSAVELRVIAEIAEPKFIPIFKSGKDIHGMMGSGFTDWTYEQICTDEEIRTKVKNINFGLPFGMGKQSFYEGLIARGTKITRKESDALYDAYFAEYDGVARLQSESTQMAETDGEVRTLFGFHRPIIEGDESRSTYFANQAVNSRVQGTAHQYLLFAMALLRTHKSHFKFLREISMEIHDALVFFSRVKYMQKAYNQLRELMVVAVPKYIEKHFHYKLKVPLECEIKCGFRLGVMVKYKGEDPKEFVEKWLKLNDETNAKVEKEWGVAA